MDYKIISKIFLVLIAFNFVSVGAVLACVCDIPAICEAYSRAGAVFIGKVEKMELDKKGSVPTMIVTFSVEKSFKGKTGKTETAKFFDGGCRDKFIVGEKYFVYKDETESLCNRTALLSILPYDLKYAQSLSESNPIFSIKGILELPEEDVKNARVTIEKGQIKYPVDVDKYGNFSFIATEKGFYRVKIVLNFEAQISKSKVDFILPQKAKFSATPSETSLEYEAEFKPNECDFKLFYIFRADKPAKLLSTSMPLDSFRF